ncbi:OPT superfamily [Sorochytrium milnesiophthora]
MTANDQESDFKKGPLDDVTTASAKDNLLLDDDFAKTVYSLLPTTDDVNTPSFTFRVWLLGSLFCALFAFVNQLMVFRTNPVYMTSYLAVLFCYPLGRLMAATLPTHKFRIPLLGECSLNPGPFSIKETVLIYIMASTGTSGVYGTDNLFVQKFNYNLDVGPWAGIGFLVATMMSGFGVAGVCQRFLVRPAHMIWPSSLPQIAFFQSFHAGDTSDRDPDVGENGRRHMSRLIFFFIALAATFVYQFIPNFLAPAVATIGLLCFFTKNPFTQVIGSPVYGTGVMSLSFDWSTITSRNSPLTNPFWVQVNALVSAIVFNWILIPASWQGRWLGGPLLKTHLNRSNLVDRNGSKVVSATLINPVDHTLDEAKYQAAAPFYASAFFIWCYFGSFASFTGAVSHVLVWYGKDIVRRFRASRLDKDEDDIHCQMIDKYPRVPGIWYLFFFIAPTVLGIIVCHASGIDMAWYYSILSVLVAIVGTVPFAFVLATSGVPLYMNVISELVIGCMYPGHPVVMMAFKCFSVTVSQATLTLLQDLKIGHYMKVPPRHIFAAQMYSQMLAVLFAYASLELWVSDPLHVKWVLKADDYTEDAVGSKWSSARVMTVYYNASLLWGAIGPIRFFFTSYTPIAIAGFLAGAILPILMKLGQHFIGGRFPWALVSAPILFSIPSPGGYNSDTVMAFAIAVFFQFFMYRRHKKWWQRYNYVLATALDVGTVLCTMAIVYGLNAAAVKAPDWALGEKAGDFCHEVKPEAALYADAIKS